jgi:hypothetical protein
MKRSLKLVVSAALIGSLLAGCSGMRVIESDVTAFPAWTSAPPTPGTPYRFDRLPSQQAVTMQQGPVEDLAKNSLSKVGMVFDPGAARFGVEVVLNTQATQRYPGGFGYGGPGVFLGAGNFGSSVGLSFPIGGFGGDPYYQREVRLTMRDLSNQRVVFETRAVQDGPWGDTLAVLPAMLDAALLGFPQPPAGTRRVNVEIPR